MIQLSTIKLALKVDYSTDDAEILRIRDAVLAWIQTYTGISLGVQNNTEYCWYFMRKRLEENPFEEITSVTYYDSTNTLTTMPATDYFLDRSNPPSIYINFSEYPSAYENTQVMINYTSGSAKMPLDIQQAAIALIGLWYNNPEAAAPISLIDVPMSARFILDQHRTKNGVLE